MGDNTVVKQAMMDGQASINPNQTVEKLALFSPDGSNAWFAQIAAYAAYDEAIADLTARVEALETP